MIGPPPGAGKWALIASQAVNDSALKLHLTLCFLRLFSAPTVARLVLQTETVWGAG